MERNLKATLHLWGNSQGIRKSKELLNRLGIAINEEDNLSMLAPGDLNHFGPG